MTYMIETKTRSKGYSLSVEEGGLISQDSGIKPEIQGQWGTHQLSPADGRTSHDREGK